MQCTMSRLGLQLEAAENSNYVHIGTHCTYPFVGRCNEYQPEGSDACSWGVKAGMVHVWVADKTV